MVIPAFRCLRGVLPPSPPSPVWRKGNSQRLDAGLLETELSAAGWLRGACAALRGSARVLLAVLPPTPVLQAAEGRAMLPEAGLHLLRLTSC